MHWSPHTSHVFSHRYHCDTSDPLKREAHNARHGETKELRVNLHLHTPGTHTSPDTLQLWTSEVFYVYYYISIGDEISTSKHSIQ
jgi:hypothetical protein